MHPYSSCRVSRKDDSVLGNAMIHKHLDSHQCRAPTRHLCVEQENAVMLSDVRRQLQVMQLWLACADVRLDQKTSSPAVRNDTAEARLESCTASKYNHSTDFSLGCQATVAVPLGRLDRLLGKVNIVQGSGNDNVSLPQASPDVACCLLRVCTYSSISRADNLSK